jgi:polyferredoxin
MPHVNYLAVIVTAVVIFVLGGLWYSPVLFAKPWTRLMGKTEEEMKAYMASPKAKSEMPLMYGMALVTALVTAWVMAIVVSHFGNPSALRGAEVGALCWLGFAATTSFATALFSMQAKGLWLINSAYNLVSFVLAGIILAVWR